MALVSQGFAREGFSGQGLAVSGLQGGQQPAAGNQFFTWRGGAAAYWRPGRDRIEVKKTS